MLRVKGNLICCPACTWRMKDPGMQSAMHSVIQITVHRVGFVNLTLSCGDRSNMHAFRRKVSASCEGMFLHRCSHGSGVTMLGWADRLVGCALIHGPLFWGCVCSSALIPSWDLEKRNFSWRLKRMLLFGATSAVKWGRRSGIVP